MLYELTMSQGMAHSSQVFEAPNNEVAEKFAAEFPTTNGWSPETYWTVGRYYPLAIDKDGRPCNSALSSEFADGWT